MAPPPAATRRYHREIANSQDLWHNLPAPVSSTSDIFALFPIHLLFFLIFQVFFCGCVGGGCAKDPWWGSFYSTTSATTLFLTGVNVGFMPAGVYLGMQLASTATAGSWYR